MVMDNIYWFITKSMPYLFFIIFLICVVLSIAQENLEIAGIGLFFLFASYATWYAKIIIQYLEGITDRLDSTKK